MTSVNSANRASHYSRNAGASNLTQFSVVIAAAADGDIELPGAAGDWCIGVIQNQPGSNELADVITLGHTKVRLGATMAAGDNFMGDTDGDAIAWTTGQYCVGFLLEGGASGAIVEAVVCHPGVTTTS